jgi:Tol biopolymer transport system component
MATGQHAFGGRTSGVIFDGILNREPTSACQLNASLPVELEQVIAKALDKDVDVRYQHASDIRADLKRLKRDSESGRVTRVARPKARLRVSRWVLALVGVLLLVAASFSFKWFSVPQKLPHPEIKQRRLTANPGNNPVNFPIISPDGKYLAYSDSAGIRIKLLATGEIQTIAAPETLAQGGDSWTAASWFPDSTRLVANFIRAGSASIWVVSVVGNKPHMLRQTGMAWSVSRDGSTIAFAMPAPVTTPATEIWLMGSNGEQPRKFLVADENEGFGRIVWEPDGDRIAYLVFHYSPPNVIETSIETRTLEGNKHNVVATDRRGKIQDFAYLTHGNIIYSRYTGTVGDAASDLWEIATDKGTGQNVGTPLRLTSWPRVNTLSLSSTADGLHLVALETISESQVYVAELADRGTRLKSEPRRLTHGDATHWGTGWAPDGQAVLIASDINGSWDLFQQRLDKDSIEPLSSTTGFKMAPRLGPDGKWILYTAWDDDAQESTPGEQMHVFRMPVSGGAPQLVHSGPGTAYPRCSRTLCVWGEPSADGKQFRFFELDPLKGKGRQLALVEGTWSNFPWLFDVSPDGSLIGWPVPGAIRLLSLKNGTTWDVKYKAPVFEIDWAVDGMGMYAGGFSVAGSFAELVYVDLQGNVRPLWREFHLVTDAIWQLRVALRIAMSGC